MQSFALPYWHPAVTPSPDAITEVADYRGTTELSVICTQLAGTHTPAQQKRIVGDWCDFFSRPQPVRRLWLHSRTPQSLFRSLCSQSDLEVLYIKWSAIDDLSPMAGLKSITHLYIGSSSKVESIDALADLRTLVDLSLCNLQGITDYSAVGRLTRLERLCIEGDGIASMKKAKVATLRPIANLTELKRLKLSWINVLDDSFACLSNLRSLKHLDLPRSCRAQDVKLLSEALAELETGNAVSTGKD